MLAPELAESDLKPDLNIEAKALCTLGVMCWKNLGMIGRQLTRIPEVISPHVQIPMIIML